MQIGDENVHRVRAVMEEVFGDQNVVSLITVVKTTGRVFGGEGSTQYNLVEPPDGAFVRSMSDEEKSQPSDT